MPPTEKKKVKDDKKAASSEPVKKEPKIEIKEKPAVEAKEKPKVEVKEKPKPVVVTPPRNRKPVPQEMKWSARQFIRGRRFRWERSSGFLLEMKNKFGPTARKTGAEWDQLWAAFWTRKV